MLRFFLRAIKKPVTKFCVAVLQKADPQLLFRIVNSQQPNQTNSQQGQVTEKKPNSSFSPLIVDSGLFTDSRYYDFLLDNFMAAVELNTEQSQKLAELKVSSFEDFTKKASQILGNQNFSLLQYFSTTEENRKAFTPSAKPFPNNVFWPNPEDKQRARSLYDDNLLLSRKVHLVDKETPVASMGSCFAFEIAHHLQRKGFRYIVSEENKGPDGFHNSSARWGTLFNTASFKQLAERVFGVKETPRLVFSSMRDGKVIYLDPFREDVIFTSPEHYAQDYYQHLDAARNALMSTRVLIITPGVNEVWRIRKCKSVLSVAPWRVAPELVEKHVFSVKENLDNLQGMLDILRYHNPRLKIIISLSPVPLHATFQGDKKHVVEANFHSKATIRCAIEEFVSRNKEVYYFPSFELSTFCVQNPWQDDQRHINKPTVAKIMKLFEEMYCA